MAGYQHHDFRFRKATQQLAMPSVSQVRPVLRRTDSMFLKGSLNLVLDGVSLGRVSLMPTCFGARCESGDSPSHV